MTAYFAYTRVSTAKQGGGVSLQEQCDAISRYAQRFNLQVSQWFEEKETAAKRGRPVFTQMLKMLKTGRAQGVIIHKIDRSTRNLKDWADLGDLIDIGVQVHFANEGLDLNTRGGRLSADIQAVVAADYIRNLREETRKGFYGRLKQGVYPLPAPIGYKDMGAGKPKELDPFMAPLVTRAFVLYATSEHSLDTLVEEMYRLGLRNRRGEKVSRNGMSTILNNPFYIGLIRLLRTKEIFQGNHRPLVSKAVFDRVQQLLDGKTTSKEWRHEFLFRRLLICRHCQRPLTGELQKGHSYYRCHTSGCITKTIRGDYLENQLTSVLKEIECSDTKAHFLQLRISALLENLEDFTSKEREGCELQLNANKTRMARLTDAYLDGSIEQSLFEERKTALLLERKENEERLHALTGDQCHLAKRVEEFFELAKSACSVYEQALPEEKRELVQIVTSNRWADGKNVMFELSFPFQVLAEHRKNTNSAPHRDDVRTVDEVAKKLLTYFAKDPKVETLVKN